MNEKVYRGILRRLGVEPAKPAPDPAVVRQVLAMPLDRFAEEGCPLEVKVPWFPLTLWFARGDADVEVLVHEGVSRGRIWTAGELLDVLAIPTMTPTYMQTVAKAKLELGGEIVEIRPRAEPARRRDGGAP